MQATRRQTASAPSLLLGALGGPKQIRDKLARLGRTARLYGNWSAVERRLDQLEAKGYVESRPTRAQVLFGSLDMLRFVIVPFARDYYEQKGISFHFHQLLRFLDDPVSLIDPTGLMSDRDTIAGHVMQVVHLNPVYDLQLLEMFPGDLQRFEDEVEQMVAGTHPRAGTIGAIIEDPEYHSRLLEYVRRFRANRETADIVRDSTLRDDESVAAAERTFATLPGFLDYCSQLPRAVPTLLRRYRRLDRFPVEMAPPT